MHFPPKTFPSHLLSSSSLFRRLYSELSFLPLPRVPVISKLPPSPHPFNVTYSSYISFYLRMVQLWFLFVSVCCFLAVISNISAGIHRLLCGSNYGSFGSLRVFNSPQQITLREFYLSVYSFPLSCHPISSSLCKKSIPSSCLVVCFLLSNHLFIYGWNRYLKQ